MTPGAEQVEEQLRDELARRAEVPPPAPGLAERALAGAALTRRRRRWGGAAVAAAAAVAVVAVTGLPGTGRPEIAPARPVTGPPRVPLLLGGEDTQLLRWRGPGDPKVTPLASGIQVVGEIPAGLLVVVTGEDPELALIRPGTGSSPVPAVLLRQLADLGVAVSADGTRATVVVRVPDTGYQGPGVTLREVELPTGRTLREVAVGPPLAAPGEQVVASAYAGDSVLLTVGDGDRQRTYRWEGGDGQVVGELTGYRRVLDGSPGGLAAFDRGEDGGGAGNGDICRVEVAALRTGGRRWQLCSGTFAGFSPDGRYVLATGPGPVLVVRDARTGEQVRTFTAPQALGGHGWETADTVLYSLLDPGAAPATDPAAVIRCSVSSGGCATAATLPAGGRAPGPVRVFGAPTP